MIDMLCVTQTRMPYVADAIEHACAMHVRFGPGAEKKWSQETWQRARVVFGVWRDAACPLGFEVVVVKGTALVLNSDGSVAMATALLCRNADHAAAICRTYGDGAMTRH